jgi:hypothetical protein
METRKVSQRREKKITARNTGVIKKIYCSVDREGLATSVVHLSILLCFQEFCCSKFLYDVQYAVQFEIRISVVRCCYFLLANGLARVRTNQKYPLFVLTLTEELTPAQSVELNVALYVNLAGNVRLTSFSCSGIRGCGKSGAPHNLKSQFSAPILPPDSLRFFGAKRPGIYVCILHYFLRHLTFTISYNYRLLVTRVLLSLVVSTAIFVSAVTIPTRRALERVRLEA